MLESKVCITVRLISHDALICAILHKRPSSFKTNTELLALRFQKKIVFSNCGVYPLQKLGIELSTVFEVDESLYHCYNIKNLFEKLGKEHIASELRLLMNFYKRSLKAALFHSAVVKSNRLM